jgi:hypothetical protein
MVHASSSKSNHEQESAMKRYWEILVATTLVAVAFAIRQVFGIEALTDALPYLVAAPSAYVLLRVFHLVRQRLSGARTAEARAKEINAGLLAAIWVVLIGIGVFQTWLSIGIWNVVISIVIVSALVLPQLLRSRPPRKAGPDKEPPPKP